jgi:hypothetical protein
VAVSGQVATPSAAERRGATRPPNTRPYQVAGGPERLQEPGGRADQGLEPPRQVGHSDGIRIHRIG